LSKSTIVDASVDYFVAGVVGATSGEADIVSVWYSFVIQMRGLTGRLIGYNAYVRSPAGRLLAVLCLLKQLVVTAVASERRKYQGFESVISEPGTVDAGGTAPLGGMPLCCRGSPGLAACTPKIGNCFGQKSAF